ncbi:conserved membrane hypothetical protein [metagenome]|uniref:Uncharacterized protein n=1 Tax=metagenome TaxID=256318 RepID=A0A2P2C0S3_9ZZZZ
MTDSTTTPLAELRNSAREWHRLQLGALAFVGLCGVIQGDSGNADPRWLQTTSGLLALAGLILAGLSVLLVATVAWPLMAAHATTPEVASRRLRSGIALTFVAVALTALAASSSWWPSDAPEPPTTVLRLG